MPTKAGVLPKILLPDYLLQEDPIEAADEIYEVCLYFDEKGPDQLAELMEQHAQVRSKISNWEKIHPGEGLDDSCLECGRWTGGDST
jgi:hypothetical protein